MPEPQFPPDEPLVPTSTAVVLIGFQNDYFVSTGALYDEIADVGAPERVLAATTRLIAGLAATDTLVVATPIVFTPSYAELVHPVGILAAVKDRGAFQAGSDGSLMVENLRGFGTRIVEIPGRRGFNAFSNTALDATLAAHGIRDVVIAGALTCVCVDSTARSAHERGFRVTVLSDCTMSRTRSEHRLFCERIFPLYAEVCTSDKVLDRLRAVTPAAA